MEILYICVLDFSKAFDIDTVRHHSLGENGLAEYAGSNIQLVRGLLNGHSHCTSFCDALSDLLDIIA